jgi:hypothetical protein
MAFLSTATRGSISRKLCESYLTARETLVRLGFAHEVDWQESHRLNNLSERDFLEQGAWTILSCGFREATVRRIFPEISRAFLYWRKARSIARNRVGCEGRARRVFNHGPKIRAIGSLCERVAHDGFDSIRKDIESNGIEFLRTFAFIGPVTAYHFAKNIGLDVVKPDRHLVRLCQAAGFNSPNEMCQLISDTTGDRLAVIDIVLWRYATVTSDYIRHFAVSTPLQESGQRG